MADLNEKFKTTKGATGGGVMIDSREEGQAEADAKSHAILPCKDQANLLQYIPLVNGKIPVTEDGGTGIIRSAFASGTVTDDTVVQDAVTLTLSLSKTYSNLEMNVSNFASSKWILEYGDDVGGAGEVYTELYPGTIRTGPGDYSHHEKYPHFELDTSSGTGVQELRIRIDQVDDDESDFSASLAVIEN